MSNDRGNKMNHHDMNVLEERIRRLSAPEVPSNLEAKLIAAIPVMKGRAIVKPRRRWLWAAAAAGVVLALTLGRAHPREVPDAATDPALRILGDTSPQHVLGEGFNPILEETKPCDTVPLYAEVG